MNLNGLRIVRASETHENRRFSTSQVKLLSGSDSLTGRYLWDKENTEFRPMHTLFLPTSFLPGRPRITPRSGSALSCSIFRTALWTSPQASSTGDATPNWRSSWMRNCRASWPGWRGGVSPTRRRA